MDDSERLGLLKQDLFLMHDKLDDYLRARIADAEQTLKEDGVDLNPYSISDNLLIVDYAAWQYRKRAANKDMPMPKNLSKRIHSKKVKTMIEKHRGIPHCN